MFCQPLVARADDFHYNNLMVGERPSGMAGAYTALSDDAAGLYYNPAGIVRGPDQVTASIYGYSQTSTEYKKVFGTTNWTKESNEFIPGYFGFIHTFPWATLGFSIAVVDSSHTNQNQDVYNIMVNGQSRWEFGRINYNNENRTYNFGPSMAIPLNEEFSVGTTLYVHYKTLKNDQNQILTNGGGSTFEALSENVRIQETEWGIRPILGVLWKPKDKGFSLGLSLSKTFLFSRDYSAQYFGTYQSPAANRNEALGVLINSSALPEYPYEATLGLAYSFSPRWLFSWDLTYYSKTDRADTDTPASTFSTRSFFNTAIGGEFRYSDRWIFRAGLFTNLSNTRLEDLPTDQTGESIDLYGATLSTTLKVKESSFTLGASYSKGNGQARLGDFGFGENRLTNQPVDAQSSLWLIFFSASF